MVDIIHLENGVTCIVDHREGDGKVAMSVGINHGSMHDPLEENGLTNLTQEATNGGTASRTRAELSQEAEERGSFVATVSRKTQTHFFSEVLAQNAYSVFDIMAEMILEPAFDPAEVEATKSQIIYQIESEKQSPVNAARQNLSAAAFEGQSIGAPTLGTRELVESFTAEQVKDKHAQMISDPSKIVVSFSGDITPEEAHELVDTYFGNMQPAVNPEPSPEVEFTGGDIREEAEGNQLNMFLSFPAPDIESDDYPAFILFNNLLSGGMSRPLFQEIREKRSLVYTVQSNYVAYADKGQFLMYAGTGKGRAGELLDTALDLLGDVITNGFSEEEMVQAKKRILNGRKEDLEVTMDTALGNMSDYLLKGHIVSAQELEERLSNVTDNDIRRVAAQMLAQGKYGFGGKGPHASLQDEQYISDKMIEKAALYDPAVAQLANDRFSQKQSNIAPEPVIEEKDPQVTVLPNGLRVVTVERPGTVSAGAWVGAGTSHETPELNGATHMNEHMMFKGTPSHVDGDVDKLIEGEYSAAMNAYTTFDKTAYYFYQMAPEDMSDVLDICGEMVFEALITKEAYEGTAEVGADGELVGSRGERAVVIEEIDRSYDNVGSVGLNLLLSSAYPNQSSGRPVLGTEETLMNMTADNLRAYRDQYYSSNNVTFVASGPVKHEDHVAMIEKKFGHLKPTTFPDLPTPEYVGDTKWVESPHAGLVNINLSTPGPKAADENSEAYSVLGVILGGGMSSRLYKSLIIEKQVAANASAGNLNFASHGLFLVRTMVAPENVKSTIQGIYENVSELIDTIDQEELEKAQTMIEVAMRKSYQNNRDIARSVGEDMVQTGETESLEQSIEKIKSVSIEDVVRAAQELLDHNPSLAMVVPVGIDPELLPTHEELLDMQAGEDPKAPGKPALDKPKL